MAYEADNNHNFKKISTVSSSLKYKEYIAVGNVKTWSKSAAGKGDQGVTGSYGWEFPFKVMGDKYYAYLSSGTFTTTGVVSGKLKYFNGLSIEYISFSRWSRDYYFKIWSISRYNSYSSKLLYSISREKWWCRNTFLDYFVSINNVFKEE